MMLGRAGFQAVKTGVYYMIWRAGPALQTACPCIFYRHICVAYVTKLAKMCHSALGSHLYPLNLAGEKKSHSVLNYI